MLSYSYKLSESLSLGEKGLVCMEEFDRKRRAERMP